MISQTLLSCQALLATMAAPGGNSDSIIKTAEDAGQGGGWMNGTGPIFVVVGLAIILFTLMRAKRKQLEQQQKKQSSLGGSGQTPEQRGRQSVERLAVDLEETARSVSALLDTKIRVLDKLIRDADERIARLEKLEGHQAGAPTPAAATAQTPPPADHAPETRAPEPEHGQLSHHAHIYSLADQGLSVQEIAEATGHPCGEVELVLSLRKIKQPGK